MNIGVLLLAIIIPFPFCLFRRKKYGVSFWKMMFIYFVFSFAGAVGACVGSYVAGGMISGKRLYGLMLFDEFTLLMMYRLLKMQAEDLGDFVSVPLMAVCFSSKIDCIIHGCCYGIVLCQNSMQQEILFPSAIFEMLIWVAYVVLLLIVEKKETGLGTLWPLTMIWFGVTRYLVDFLRGDPIEKEPFLFSMTGGRFWSLIVLALGLIHLYFILKKKLGNKPSARQYFCSIFGMNTTNRNVMSN